MGPAVYAIAFAQSAHDRYNLKTDESDQETDGGYMRDYFGWEQGDLETFTKEERY